MLVSTTSTLQGKNIEEYLGVITAEVIIGANFIKDIMGGLRDFFGGRSSTYEKVLEEARQSALTELMQKAQSLGANAIIGIDLDFEEALQSRKSIWPVLLYRFRKTVKRIDFLRCRFYRSEKLGLDFAASSTLYKRTFLNQRKREKK